MASLNKVILIGNLTRDPELRYTPKGSAVAEFALATNRKFKGASGDAQEEVTFIEIVLWGKSAEVAGKHLSKGSSVYVEGRLQTESWEDKQTGQKRSRMRVVGESFQFVGAKRDSGGFDTSNDGHRMQSRTLKTHQQEPEEHGEDIPF